MTVQTTTYEHVDHGMRFKLAKGSSMIAVSQADAVSTAVPFDMMDIPDWINRAQLDEEAFRLLCHLWHARMAGVS